MKYRREIDGLRAVAVVPVILFHAGFSAFSGGYVGVDVFFVISGYLITSILLKDLAENRFSIWRFYERRARRILPALILVVAVCIPIAWVLMMPFPFRNFAQSVVAVSLSASNILFWLETGYFDAAAELKPLLHTWSLAVEEQYYILLPPLLALLWKSGRGNVRTGLWILAAASFAACLWMLDRYPSATFFLLPTRAWELLAGSLCALVRIRDGQGGGWRDAAALTGLGLLVASIALFDDGTPFPSAWTLVPVAGTVLVILFATTGTFTARLLSLAPFVGIGLISYSAYLWHQPVFAFARIYLGVEPAHGVMLALSAGSLGLAWLSWRFVELPFRTAPGRRRGTAPLFGDRRTVFAASGLALATMATIGLIGDRTRLQTEWWRAQQSAESLRVYEMLGLSKQAGAKRVAALSTLSPTDCRFRADFETVDPDAAFAAIGDHLAACRDIHGPGLLVLGDSHAGNLFLALEEALPAGFILGVTTGGCRPHTPEPGCYFDALETLLSDTPDLFSMAIYEQAGFYLMRDSGGGGPADRALFLHEPLDRPVPAYPPHSGHIDRVADFLEGLPAQMQTVWFGPRPDPHIPEGLLVRGGCAATFDLRPGQAEAYASVDRAIAARLSDSAVSFVSQIDALDLDMRKDFMSCDRLLWSDGDHFTLDGGRHFAPRILAALPLGAFSRQQADGTD